MFPMNYWTIFIWQTSICFMTKWFWETLLCLCWSNDKSYFISFFQLQKISIFFTDTITLILTEISKKILDKEVAKVKWQDNSEDFLLKLKVHCHNMIQRAYFITGPWIIKYENEEKYFLFQPSSSPLSYHR